MLYAETSESKMSKSVSRVLYLTAIYLGASLPVRSSHLPRTAGPAICPFHGVAPDRVYSVPKLPGGRVSSYLAFPSLLPQRGSGISLLHFSSDHSGRVLPVILALRSPDFPHRRPFGAVRAAVWPTQQNILSDAAGKVKI